MKKILFFIPSLKTGGSERMFLNILNSLNLKKYKPTLVIVRKGTDEYLSELKPEIKVIKLNCDRVRNSIFKIYKCIYENKPDIVISTLTDLNIIIGMLSPMFPKIKFIARESNVLSELLKDKKKFNFFVKIFYKFFNCIVAQSDDMKEDMIKNYNISETKIVKINNFIDDVRIEKNINKDEEYSFELCEKDFNIVTVGRLEKQKGFNKLIEIFKKLYAENVKLYIIGEGTERKNLEIIIKKNDLEEKVILLGKKTNPYIYMKKADIYILSSEYEGFPNSLLEALYCGKFSIVNDCKGGIREIINEKNGIILNFNDHEIVLNTIMEIKKNINDIKKLSPEIKNDVMNRFSKQKLILQYENLFEWCVKSKQGEL